jgi:bacterioferritin-associated ferredoxin
MAYRGVVVGPAEGRTRWHPTIWHPMMGFAKSSTHPTSCDAIADGARSAAEIGVQLKAGTNCGSCIPELKRLIAQTDVKSAGADPEQRQFARVAN